MDGGVPSNLKGKPGTGAPMPTLEPSLVHKQAAKLTFAAHKLGLIKETKLLPTSIATRLQL